MQIQSINTNKYSPHALVLTKRYWNVHEHDHVADENSDNIRIWFPIELILNRTLWKIEALIVQDRK